MPGDPPEPPATMQNVGGTALIGRVTSQGRDVQFSDIFDQNRSLRAGSSEHDDDPRPGGTRPEPTLRSPMPAQTTPSPRPVSGASRPRRKQRGRSLLAALVGCMTLVPVLLAVTPGVASAALTRTTPPSR